MTIKEYDKFFVKKSFNKEVDEVKIKFEVFIDRAKKILPSIDPFDSSKFRDKFFDKNFNTSR
jgi:hypothetical protein